MPVAHDAIALRNLGFSVFPVDGKKPIIAWKEYQERIADEEEVCAWWRTGDWNIGIATGRVSSIIVLDIDGDAGYTALLENDLEVGRTVCARTGRGTHYYFQHPGYTVGNFAGRLDHVDLRGDGGYVVAPPSVHSSGKSYQWIVSPVEMKPVKAPTWLLGMTAPDPKPRHIEPLRVTDAYLKGAIASAYQRISEAREGTRNDTLNREAYGIGQLLASADESASEYVHQYLAEAAANAGLTEDEVRATLGRSIRDGMDNPREGAVHVYQEIRLR